MKRMKKKLLALSMTAICISAMAAGTLAYYTSETTIHNTISSGKIEIDVLDVEGSDAMPLTVKEDDKEQALKIMPGKEIPYRGVAVSNIGSSPAWVRVKATTVIISKDGTELSNKIDGTDEYVIQYKLSENWIDGQDGFYYYKYPVNSSSVENEASVTDHLIQGIKVSPKMGNGYQGCEVHITVSAQAVQSKNNMPESGNVTDVKGWPDSDSTATNDTAKEE